MALGDLMASRISQSSLAVVSNHLDDCASNHDEDVDLISLRRDSEAASSSYGNAVVSTATTMVYLPQTIVLCELRHDAFEACLPAGPSESGLVSKWRPKDRVSRFTSILFCCCFFHFMNFFFFSVRAGFMLISFPLVSCSIVHFCYFS